MGGVRQLSLQVQMHSNSLFFSQASTQNLSQTASLRQTVDDKKRNIFCEKYFFIKILCKDIYCIVAPNANLSRRSSNESQAAT